MQTEHGDTREGVAPAEARRAPASQAVELTPATRQRSVTFTYAGPTTPADEGAALPLALHLSIRCFADYILLFVTEEATCAPGVLLRYDAPAVGPSAFMYDGETPSLDFTVLLGLRDHPLTNLLASSIAHRVRRFGEARPLLMGLSVVQSAKQLRSGDAKKQFLAFATNSVLELAGEAQSA